MLRHAIFAAAIFGVAIPTALWAQTATVSGGVDLRAATGDGTAARLEGAFLNYRQVIDVDGADRWIGVAQIDSGTNAEDPHLYQTYLQYKGPLGRWNTVAGRFIVPFCSSSISSSAAWRSTTRWSIFAALHSSPRRS